MRTIVLTAFALLAFAANSVLCRQALATGQIEPAAFTLIRLTSGAICLALLILVRRREALAQARKWFSAFLLFAYAAAFSFAYVKLTAGTGALILFSSVQATMIIAAIRAEQHPKPTEWLGLGLALAGLIYLVLPGIAAPPLFQAALMACAGIAWGLYSLMGRTVADPAAATAGNFLRSVPFAVALAAPSLQNLKLTNAGIVLAVVSGAVTSGLGYVLWYSVVPSLGATRAAIVQLLVPIVAAFGGIVFLNEVLTPRLLVAAALSLAGVSLAIFFRQKLR